VPGHLPKRVLSNTGNTPIMGVAGMEKLKPHYLLADIKAAFADPTTLNRSFVSKQGSDDLGMDDAAVVAVIQALVGSDFEKSMTSYANTQVWQDVYRPSAGGKKLYVKFTLDARNNFFLISFKEA
jgi:motility quorum-sensing regulator/GCU-specific mRNA interferase toxin